MTYVSGVVQDWLQVALEQEDRGVHHAWLYSWSSFVKEMHTYFGIPDVTAEAAHSLDHLRMNPDDRIAIYNVAFLRYSAQLQWTESALCHRYYSGLPDRIQDIISTREGGKPSTFQTRDADCCWKGAKRPDKQHYLQLCRPLLEGSNVT